MDGALARGIKPFAMLFNADELQDGDPRVAATEGLAERYLVPPKLMGYASALAAAPRVIAILPQPPVRSFSDVRFPPSLGLYLAGVADPGNVGTLVRTGAALGADWLALGPGSADAFHPRAVRAAMGSTFAIPVLENVTPADLATRSGFAVMAAVPRDGVAPWEADLTQPLVLALGAERLGLGPAPRGPVGRPRRDPRDHPAGRGRGVAQRRRRRRGAARRGRPPARPRTVRRAGRRLG